ncbi:MAG TPA: hypothetical protein VGF75_03705 [Candidatus Saccharimonadales bacterium]|jgi:lincosamide nucleotidyltransferase A/C/D/E
MTSDDVLNLYNELEKLGITIWIDGGWCVDALIGHQTRQHDDLDIAIKRNDNEKLKSFFESSSYNDENRPDSTDWNYVKRKGNEKIDVHVCDFDDVGNNIYGVKYPIDSLNGMGVINNKNVRCISPEWMFKFKTSYTPKGKDSKDIEALSLKFGFKQ